LGEKILKTAPLEEKRTKIYWEITPDRFKPLQSKVITPDENGNCSNKASRSAKASNRGLEKTFKKDA